MILHGLAESVSLLQFWYTSDSWMQKDLLLMRSSQQLASRNHRWKSGKLMKYIITGSVDAHSAFGVFGGQGPRILSRPTTDVYKEPFLTKKVRSGPLAECWLANAF